MLLLFFSILAFTTSNTKWLIYRRSQHLTRIANDFPVFLLNRSKLPICSYYFFLFWPLTLQTLNGSSTVLVSTLQVSPMTFLSFLLNRSKLSKCSDYFLLLCPLTLQTLNGSSTVLVSTLQVSPMTFLPFLLNRSKLP